MSSSGESQLVEVLGAILGERMETAAAGHCLRVDDVEEAIAAALYSSLAGAIGEGIVYVLKAHPSDPGQIAPERAVEIRNRKEGALLLLVPAGEGHAASSLDNSFQRIPVREVYGEAEPRLRKKLSHTPLADPVQRTLRRYYARQTEWWAEFLAELCADPTPEGFGRNLWRIGLVPDSGEAPWSRLEKNRVATRAIAQPSRPAASLDERFTAGGLREGAWRAQLRVFLEDAGSSVANPRAWARAISEQRSDLTFDHWLLAEAIEEDIDSLELEPFVRSDGSLDKACKLTLGTDGELVLEVPRDSTASLVVKWRTDPPKVSAVSKWSLEILPPSDLRGPDSEPIASAVVKGDKRRCTVKVSIDEDSLATGTRFVVALAALGESGEQINLKDGSPAIADSQEFQVAISGAEPEARSRRAAAASLPEAALRAAVDGMDDLTEDLVSWDLDGQVFGVRLGNRRAVQIRVSELLIRLQREIASQPEAATHFVARTAYGSVLDAESLEQRSLVLPATLRKVRADFLRELPDRAPRDTVESLSWDPELREKARAYLASYSRALNDAEGEVLRDLLLLDSMSLTVRRSNRLVRSVVLLPLHPLRLAWIAEYDDTFRRWAALLTDVTPRGARGSLVDVGMASRVVPANLPFTLLDAEGNTAYYAEELTYGCAVYLIPGDLDSEAAAEAVASAFSLPRTGSSLKASSGMVEERINAYEASHEPSETVRILAVHPGAGELVAGAIGGLLNPLGGQGDDDVAVDDPHRVEIVCYTDSASYIAPVPALLSLQRSLRVREYSRRSSHLAPPLSVTVRAADRLLEDDLPAHLAVVQDVGQPSAGMDRSADRAASFRDLLVPLVTRSRDVEGDLVWDSVPVTGLTTDKTLASTPVAHRVHQRAMARFLSAPDEAVPSMRVVLDGERRARIRTAHNRADWVIGIDRYVGVDLYESGVDLGLPHAYILDYAPDFVEGIGDRLTVTTANRAEVENLLARAMKDLGLDLVDQSVGGVLSTLSVVSGRLALRLLGDTSLAREAVSLAAVITHLRERGELDGLIVVPVDAHPEIFGPAAREDDGGARRCDLLLVRVGQRSFKIECVEVKSRQEARLPQALAERIVEQVTDTRRLLESRFFATDPPRIDAELQRARLASVLHYYADRSRGHGLIQDDRIEETHRYIDARMEESAEITMKGFVVSLEGAQGFKKRYGDVPVTVLTADDLGRIGFTSRIVDTGAEDIRSKEPGTAGKGSARQEHAESEPDGSGDAGNRENPGESAGADRPTAETSESGEPSVSGGENQAGEDEPSLAEGQTPTEPVVTSSAGRESTSSPDVPVAPETVEVVLGKVEGGSEVVWRLSTKGSPHAFIIGIPGQGKSVTTRKVIRDFSRQALPAIVFDFHGDMAANPPEGATVLDASEGLPFSPFEPDAGQDKNINITAWEIAEVIGYVAKLGDIQRNHVYRALVNAYAAHGWIGKEVGDGTPTMEEFAAAVEAVETGARGRNARDRLRPFTDFGLFADNASGGFRVLEGHHGLVLDVSKVGLEEVQRFAASFLLRRIYREMFAWDQTSRLRLSVVLDEAHRLARDVTLPKIMKEGRKYGVAVVVASQSADDFHDDVLGNAGAKIIFRTNFPASKAVAGYLRGRGGQDLSQEIEKLNVGVAFVSTPDAAQARRVYMDQ